MFTAEVQFRFECESVGRAGSSLRDLTHAARAVGFEVIRARIEPASEIVGEGSGRTKYGADA
jgi:hypothetical protein